VFSWGGERLFDTPPQSINSRNEATVRQSNCSCPLSDSLSLSVESQEMVGAGIVALYKRSTPLTISIPVIFKTIFAMTARVVSVIILSFDRVSE